jgi:hypothetical protein
MLTYSTSRLTASRGAVALLICAALIALSSCRRGPAPARTFNSPEEAVKALASAVTNENVDDVLQIFGPDGKDLIDNSDPASARRGRQVFTAAVTERWKLVDRDRGKTLVIGNEEWPFPVPLIQTAQGWHFDAAAGKEEVITRRIGRNELAAIEICQTYVAAQRRYARTAHDGNRPGLFATVFRSDPGKQNGLFWPARRGEPRSPLGDLLAEAADPARLRPDGAKPPPFHGYFFKILTAQGPSGTGGARNYVIDGAMAHGFALVAWPAHYDSTGVMTFIVNQDGIVREKDLGPETDATARAMAIYEPDPSWTFAH